MCFNFGCPELAEDATQKVAFDTWQGRKTDLTRLCIDYIRTQRGDKKRAKFITGRLRDDKTDYVGQLVDVFADSRFERTHLDTLEDRESIIAAFRCVDERRQRMMYLYFVEDHTMLEIAGMYCLEESRISQILNECLSRIRYLNIKQSD